MRASRRSIRGPGWDSRSRSASSRLKEAPSASRARRARAAPSSRCSRAEETRNGSRIRKGTVGKPPRTDPPSHASRKRLAPGGVSAVLVLVVDDNIVNQKLLRVALEIEGFETTVAFDADKALRTLHDHRPA